MQEQTSDIQKPLLPNIILDLNYAFSKTALLVAAVRLHLFTNLHQKVLTAAQIASLIGSRTEPTERFLMGLASLGMLEHTDDTYTLTPLAEHFLVEDKPAYLGGDTLGMVDYVPAWLELDQVLTTSQPYRDLGAAAVAEVFFAPRVHDLFPLVYPVALRTLERLALPVDLDVPLRILDVAAGSVPWSAPFAQRYPQSQITAVDLPAVAEQGKQQVAELGLQDRYTWIAQDIETVDFRDHDYELILIGHLFRFIGEERSRALLSQLKPSLSSSSVLIVSDVFLNDDRSGPPAAVNLNLSMLVNSANGLIPTCQEVTQWLTSSGFSRVQRLTGVGPFPVLVASDFLG